MNFPFVSSTMLDVNLFIEEQGVSLSFFLSLMQSSAQIRSEGCQTHGDKNSNFIPCISFEFHPTSENLMIFLSFFLTLQSKDEESPW